MNTRIDVIKDKLRDNTIDALLVQTPANVYYLSGFDTDPHERLVAVLVFVSGESVLVCPHMEVNQAEKVFHGTVIGYRDTDDPWYKLKEYLDRSSIKISGIAVESSLAWKRMQALQSILKGVSVLEADTYLNDLRLVKDDTEIERIGEAAKLADKGIQVGVESLREGITELEVIASIEYELKKLGVTKLSFSTTVVFGANAGDAHGKPGGQGLKKGDAVLMDLGVVWKGYCSDITRTVFFDHASENNRKIYNIVLAAQQKALEACKPGVPISTVDRAARDEISKEGFAEYFPHRIGHGIGIEVHEFPSLNDQNAAPLLAGMTFTVEPGIYIPEKMGVRIEDDVLVTEDGCTALTSFPKDITIITN